MDCPICGTRIEQGWTFCPRCGSRISGDFFNEIFSRMRKQLAEMNKLLEKDIEAFDLSPWFRDMDKKGQKEGNSAFNPHFRPKSSGFSIKIVQSGGRKPEVSVKTFGDVNREKLRKEIEGLGAWQPAHGKEGGTMDRRRLLTPSSHSDLPSESGKAARAGKLPMKESMRTEEPRTSVARSASKVVVSIELPGVEPQDIEISELENSVEVRALAHDKAYFKILTKPPQFRLARKSFLKGVLQMEFS